MRSALRVASRQIGPLRPRFLRPIFPFCAVIVTPIPTLLRLQSVLDILSIPRTLSTLRTLSPPHTLSSLRAVRTLCITTRIIVSPSNPVQEAVSVRAVTGAVMLGDPPGTFALQRPRA